MVKKKKIKNKGKLSFSRYFQEFEPGEKVAIVKELSLDSNFPSRLQGSTGEIESRRGTSYIVKVKTQNKEKKFLIEPIHLKKINQF